MDLLQHQGAFSTLRLASPVQETSNSPRFFDHILYIRIKSSKSTQYLSFEGVKCWNQTSGIEYFVMLFINF